MFGDSVNKKMLILCHLAKKVSWSNNLTESQLLTSLHLSYLPSPQLMFWPTNVTITYKQGA